MLIRKCVSLSLFTHFVFQIELPVARSMVPPLWSLLWILIGTMEGQSPPNKWLWYVTFRIIFLETMQYFLLCNICISVIRMYSIHLGLATTFCFRTRDVFFYISSIIIWFYQMYFNEASRLLKRILIQFFRVTSSLKGINLLLTYSCLVIE